MARKTIYSAGYRQLVEQLRTNRERLSLSQAELSRTLGWTQQKLSAVETGSRRLDIMEYFLLTEALGLSPSDALNLVQDAINSR